MTRESYPADPANVEEHFPMKHRACGGVAQYVSRDGLERMRERGIKFQCIKCLQPCMADDLTEET